MSLEPLGLALAALEGAWNAILRAHPAAAAQAAALDGRIAALEIEGLGRFYVVAEGERLHLQPSWEGEADATLRGSPAAFAALARERSEAAEPGVSIVGDAELGASFSALLGEIAGHWEAPLGGWIGAERALQLRRQLDAALDWGAQTLGALARELGAAVEVRIAVLPRRGEFEDFAAAVGVLAERVERLAARAEVLGEGAGA